MFGCGIWLGNVVVFFFSSRRRHTIFDCDWSFRRVLFRSGDEAILKVVPVEDDEADHEADALALLAGDGAVRLLRHDRARRAMLIERARPGYDASGLSEYEADRKSVV